MSTLWLQWRLRWGGNQSEMLLKTHFSLRVMSPLFLCDFNQKPEQCRQILMKLPIRTVTKIHPVGGEISRGGQRGEWACRRTDRHDKANVCCSEFRRTWLLRMLFRVQENVAITSVVQSSGERGYYKTKCFLLY
jgi:hypothetical protein